MTPTILHGSHAPASPPAPALFNGGCIFAEHPERDAGHARIIWHADLDPGTLHVVATPVAASDPDRIDVRLLLPWLTIATDPDGREHAVLSDGWHHIRLDIEAGSVVTDTPVLLQYRIFGMTSAMAKILPLRRFLDLCRVGRFSASLFPRDPRIERWLTMLQVHDALTAGASHREIGEILFGSDRVARDWNSRSDSLRSRIRRLANEARGMARGGYRTLLQPGVKSRSP